MATPPVVVLSSAPGRRAFTQVSPTQVESYRACPRQWYTKYVLGMFTPSTPAQELGTAVHTVLENWLRDGTPPPETAAGIIAKAGLHLLPAPKTEGLHVEGMVEIPGAPMRMVGKIDLTDERPGVPTVFDHKTASDPKWVKEKEELAGNVQLISYAQYGLSKHPNVGIIRVVHTYFGTRTAWAKQVEMTVSRKKVEEEWAGICGTIREMQADAVKDEADVVQVPSACSAYGGCPYKERCWGGGKGQTIDVPREIPTVPPQQLDLVAAVAAEVSTGGTRVSNPLDDLRNSILGGAAPTPSVAGAWTVTPSAGTAGGTTTPPAVAAGILPAPRPDLPGGRDGVNPPKRPVKETDTGMELTATGAKKTRRTRVATPPAAAAGAAPATAPPAAAPATAPPAATVPAAASTAPAPAATTNGRRKKLYIGCWPTKGVVCVDFSDWSRPFQEAVAKGRNVPHIAAVDFGKAYQDVVVEFRHHGWPDDVEAFYIDNMGPSKACVEVLIQMADEVVHKM